jgi:hypothetical protein
MVLFSTTAKMSYTIWQMSQISDDLGTYDLILSKYFHYKPTFCEMRMKMTLKYTKHAFLDSENNTLPYPHVGRPFSNFSKTKN